MYGLGRPACFEWRDGRNKKRGLRREPRCLEKINPDELFHRDLTLHEAKVPGEGAEVVVNTSFFEGDGDGVGFAGSEKFAVSQDFTFGGIIGRDEVGILGGHGLHGEGGDFFVFIQDNEVVAHSDLGKLADVFKGDLHFFTDFDLECFFIELHLVVAVDDDFLLSKKRSGSEREGCGEKGGN